jgi:hypothetical protein
MNYFDHHFVSNSNLKELRAKVDPKFQPPVNLDEIYHAGTINHQALLEPYKCDKTHAKYPLAKEMADTVLRDRLCAKIIMLPDFRREHEWYRIHTHGLKGVRCKTDGDSKQGSVIFEYKGLAVTTDKAFEEAIYHFDYDQAVAWYMPIVRHKFYLIAGVSKAYPDRLFKRLVDKDHPYFKSGTKKLAASKKMWDTYIGDMNL